MNGLGNINGWAVVLAAVLYYVLGALWFSPLFGRAWDRSLGYDRSSANGRFPSSYYVVPLIGSGMVTIVIATFAAQLQQLSILGAAAAGAGIGVAIAASTLTNALTPNTPHPYLFAAITAGYHFVGCTIAGAVIGAIPG